MSPLTPLMQHLVPFLFLFIFLFLPAFAARSKLAPDERGRERGKRKISLGGAS